MKIFAAMSGGVDSSVAAALLAKEGHDVTGVTMRLYDGGGGASSLKSCCGFGPAFDAQRVAEKIGIRHMILDYRKHFRNGVIDPFAEHYSAGKTPNPCILCNTVLKFGTLLETAIQLGFDAVATGHYARIVNGALLTGVDGNKDQSYFLYGLGQNNMSRVLFPVGDKVKPDIRAIAKEMDLPVHDKQESQDICFIPNGQYRDFLENRGIKGVKGFMFNTSGEIVGEHEGLHRYTVGQRKGLGPLGERTYVIRLEPERNALIVGTKEELLCNGVVVSQPHFCRLVPGAGSNTKVRLRYRAPLIDATIEELNAETMTLRFASPSEAAASGQSAVLYNGDEVVGGGIILRML
ncbi:MAG: tRNA 2-thiouridine(34) synthase MnmA [Fibrobacteres bacterium]|nr:tRNA 2-thiouridine(34) synthase MnmA [Fibrobacterota bacterium]